MKFNDQSTSCTGVHNVACFAAHSVFVTLIEGLMVSYNLALFMLVKKIPITFCSCEFFSPQTLFLATSFSFYQIAFPFLLLRPRFLIKQNYHMLKNKVDETLNINLHSVGEHIETDLVDASRVL